MSTTTIDGNYSIILPVMKQGREQNRKEEKNKKQEESLSKAFYVRKPNTKKIYYFTNFVRAFAVVSLV